MSYVVPASGAVMSSENFLFKGETRESDEIVCWGNNDLFDGQLGYGR